MKNVTINGRNVKEIRLNGGLFFRRFLPPEFQALERVYFDGSGMITLPHILTGADTILAKFKTNATSGNLFGYFDNSASDKNFCLYGSSSSYIRYDGGLYRNWDLRADTGVHDVVFSPRGLTDNGSSIASYAAKTFTGGECCLGGLPNSTTIKNKWWVYHFEVSGKCDLYPAKRIRDNKAGMYDVKNDVFYTGSFIG